MIRHIFCCVIVWFSGATMVKGIEGVTKVYVNPHVAEVINFRNGYVQCKFDHVYLGCLIYNITCVVHSGNLQCICL
jgi:hypothetical protein